MEQDNAQHAGEAGAGFVLYLLKRSGYRLEPADRARLEDILAQVGHGRALDSAARCAEVGARVNEEMAEKARRALHSERAELKEMAIGLARVPRAARNTDWRTAARQVAAAYTRLNQIPKGFEAKARRERGHAADLHQLKTEFCPAARTRSGTTIVPPAGRRTAPRPRGAGRPAARPPRRRSGASSRAGPDGEDGEPPGLALAGREEHKAGGFTFAAFHRATRGLLTGPERLHAFGALPERVQVQAWDHLAREVREARP